MCRIKTFFIKTINDLFFIDSFRDILQTCIILKTINSKKIMSSYSIFIQAAKNI